MNDRREALRCETGSREQGPLGPEIRWPTDAACEQRIRERAGCVDSAEYREACDHLSLQRRGVIEKSKGNESAARPQDQQGLDDIEANADCAKHDHRNGHAWRRLRAARRYACNGSGHRFSAYAW